MYTTQFRPWTLCSAPTTHPLLILKHLQVGVSMSATLETPRAAQIAETHVTTEVAETIKSEVDPLQEEVSTSLWKIITSLELSSSRWLRSSGAGTDHPDHRRQSLLNQAWAWPWRDSRNIGHYTRRSEEYRPKQEWWRWGRQCGWQPSGRLCGSWGGWRARILFLWRNHSKGKLLVSTRMIKEILWFENWCYILY